jgi:predicted Holliday junction resolvase-like endonuclease
LFYLSEARPYLRGRQPRSIVDSIRAEELRLERAEERLDQIEGALREKAAEAGLRAAKKLQKKIDPLFSGSGYNPHDVKVIFDPVTYVVFHGMGGGRLREIVRFQIQPRTAPARNCGGRSVTPLKTEMLNSGYCMSIRKEKLRKSNAGTS